LRVLATERAWTMTRKVAKQVATTGIDIDKNSLHLLGLEGCFGSTFTVTALTDPRPELGVKQPKSVTTSAFGGNLPVAEGALGQLLLAISRLMQFHDSSRNLVHRGASVGAVCSIKLRRSSATYSHV
jgi:hypothetical protein